MSGVGDSIAAFGLIQIFRASWTPHETRFKALYGWSRPIRSQMCLAGDKSAGSFIEYLHRTRSYKIQTYQTSASGPTSFRERSGILFDPSYAEVGKLQGLAEEAQATANIRPTARWRWHWPVVLCGRRRFKASWQSLHSLMDFSQSPLDKCRWFVFRH